MSDDIYFIDANIIMYAVGAIHPLKEPCAQILSAIGEQQIHSVTSVEVLQEILHRYSALKRRDDPIAIVQRLVFLVDEVLPITPADIERALIIHRQFHWLMARESLHAATMLNHGLTAIVTADAHFDGLPGIVRIDPGHWQAHCPHRSASAQAVSVVVTRPARPHSGRRPPHPP